MSVEGGVVRVGDGGNDGQAETEAVVDACSVGGHALERFEEATDLVGGHLGPGVGHLDSRLASLGVDQDADAPPGWL